MTDTTPLVHRLSSGITVACLSCPEHGMEGWDRLVARSKAQDARVKRMHREYRRRTRKGQRRG